jgi:hypothetical protein
MWGVDCFNLVQGRDKSRALVNAVKNLRGISWPAEGLLAFEHRLCQWSSFNVHSKQRVYHFFNFTLTKALVGQFALSKFPALYTFGMESIFRRLAFYKHSASTSSSVIRHHLTSKKYITPLMFKLMFHCLSYLFHLCFLRSYYTSGRGFSFAIRSVSAFFLQRNWLPVQRILLHGVSYWDSVMIVTKLTLEQCFSTAGPPPGIGPWHQLYRAARGSPGICHISFLSIFHEEVFYNNVIILYIFGDQNGICQWRSAQINLMVLACENCNMLQDFISPVIDN